MNLQDFIARQTKSHYNSPPINDDYNLDSFDCSDCGYNYFDQSFDLHHDFELSESNGILVDNLAVSNNYSSDQVYSSPMSNSCITEEACDMRQKLLEIEMKMIDSELDNCVAESETNKLRQIFQKRDLESILIACAAAVAENRMLTAEYLIAELREIVSVCGDPLQRVGAYMLEGIVARLAQSGSSLYKSLRCREPTGPDLLSYMHLLYEVCPYFKFGYMSANGAIAEAMKGEERIHIIDFQIAQGEQWRTLIPALAAQPGGPPRIRITGMDDAFSSYARGGGLDVVEQRLSAMAASCRVPFEFESVVISGLEVEVDDLGIRPEEGEAIAVNFVFMLHHMPDESVTMMNHRDRLLRMAKSLSPKVVTLVEIESNSNTSSFLNRFIETLKYNSAVFESIDATLSRDHEDRIKIEQHCLARDIVNIIACEGFERIERYESFGKWKSRFLMAGFASCPLSPVVNATLGTLLEKYCSLYKVEESDDALFLGWKNRALVTSSAWR